MTLNENARVLTWHWKGPGPDIEELDEVLSDLSNGLVRVQSVDTDGSDYGIVVSRGELTEEQAQAAWEEWDPLSEDGDDE